MREFDAKTWQWKLTPAFEPEIREETLDPLRAKLTTRGGRDFDIGALFVAFRARGLAPHGRGESEDAAFAAVLARLAGRGGSARKGAADIGPALDDVNAQPGDWHGGDEEHVEPDPVFGVSEGMFPQPGSDNASIYGSFEQMVADIADMGAGHIRRVKFCDVYWGSVYPTTGPRELEDKEEPSEPSFQYGKQVPPPAALLADLRENSFKVFGYLTEFLLACLAAGIRVTLTPFHPGGGSPLAANIGDKGGVNSDIEPPEGTWPDIVRARPVQQKGVRLASDKGWHLWYHGHGGAAVDPDEALYEKYCIHVWPTRESEGFSTSAYMRECARRKSLGIAAFCTGVAEYLVRIDEVLRAATGGEASVHDVVEFIELGNEIDGLYRIPSSAAQLAEMHPVDRDIDAIRAELGAREAGRYMALIAGPFRRLLPQMKFRAAELLSSKPVDAELVGSDGCRWDDLASARRVWLRNAILIGMQAETELWHEFQRALLLERLGLASVPDEVAEWVDTCESAGWYWPPYSSVAEDPLGLTARDLVHEVGFHWYHGYNVDVNKRIGTDLFEVGPGTFLYFDAERLAADVYAMRDEVVTPLRAAGFGVTISLGEIGFAASWPEGTDSAALQKAYYEGTNEVFQAAMLVRLLTVARIAGVAHVYWFCHLLKPLKVEDGVVSQWRGEVLASGLHNDLFESTVSSYDHFQATGAYCRPAWYSFRRLVWLFGQARNNGVTLHVNEGGRTAVRLRMRAPLSRDPDGTPVAEPYRFAWLIWLDQYSDSSCHHPEGDGTTAPADVTLYDTGGRGYRFLPLIPEVTVAGDDATDHNGYKAGSANWYFGDDDPLDPEWREAVAVNFGERENARGISYLYFTLHQAGPAYAACPICVLTDADHLVFA
ncbi:MAG: hypothetical protein Q8P18_04170 [Pseudomonadota bacterium]|nr:hypothetical protein [Pseudomonadota bacterium]